jgi:hypothetical protein
MKNKFFYIFFFLTPDMDSLSVSRAKNDILSYCFNNRIYSLHNIIHIDVIIFILRTNTLTFFKRRKKLYVLFFLHQINFFHFEINHITMTFCKHRNVWTGYKSCFTISNYSYTYWIIGTFFDIFFIIFKYKCYWKFLNLIF